MTQRFKTGILVLVLLMMGLAAFNFLTQLFPYAYSQILLLVGLILYVLIYLKQAIEGKDTLERKKSTIRHRSVLISVLVVFGFLVLNLIAFRTNRSLDVTATKAFTFTDYTRQVLRNLKNPVQLKVFVRQSGVTEELEFYLGRFQKASKEQFTFEFIDPARSPEQAERYRIPPNQNVAVLISGKREERLYTFREGALIAAMLRVQQDQPRKIYFTQGHGEHSAEEAGREGYGSLWQQLMEEGYKPEPLVLKEVGKIPEDVEIVVIGGPIVNFASEEIDEIEADLNRGGKLLCLLDPTSDGGLTGLLSRWSVRVSRGAIYDESGTGKLLGASPDHIFVRRYGLHPITENYGIATIFPLVRPVETGLEGQAKAVPFVLTMEKIRYQDPFTRESRPGPLSVAVAVEGKAADASKTTRIVVFGDSDFANNLFLTKFGNLDLVLNTFRWLSQDEQLIGQRFRETRERLIRFDRRYFMYLFYALLFVLPITSAGTGLYFWNRRRNLK